MTCEGCEGCDLLCTDEDIEYVNEEGEKVCCPCMICIVKIMCIKDCDDYGKFVTNNPAYI